MDKKQFYETYCLHCGTQRCEGIDSEWGEGCHYRWNLDDVDAAAEIEKLNTKIMELGYKLMNSTPTVHGKWYDEDSFDAHGSPIYRCSVCNKTVADNYISCHKFCLHCGAKMDGGNSND